ncbi:MAG: CoA ester lyase [Actinomycetota bacterium]|nr:CoA ester lyase [Actinomycetota bacterium]
MNQVNLRRRSILCVPAGDEHRLGKALASAADEVVIDLEDAVALENKASARRQLADFSWPDQTPSVTIRVNAVRTPWCHRDLEAVVGIARVRSVVVPKVESRGDLGFAERLLDGLEAEADRAEPLRIQALVETAAGVTALADIVSDIQRLEAVVVGYADLAASLGRDRRLNHQAWAGVQDTVVLHARAAGVCAVDGPFIGARDDQPFRDAVAAAAACGFDGKWVIHPRQIEAVNDGFTPAADEVDHARRVLDALEGARLDGRGAAALGGALVDEAMARDARRVLAKAGV